MDLAAPALLRRCVWYMYGCYRGVAQELQLPQTMHEPMPLMKAGAARLAHAWCREYLNMHFYQA